MKKCNDLSDSADLFVLRAKIAFEEDEQDQIKDWLVQAAIIDTENPSLREFKNFLSAAEKLKDGMLEEAQKELKEFEEDARPLHLFSLCFGLPLTLEIFGHGFSHFPFGSGD